MKAKSFDCVKMKHDIQQELIHDMKDLSTDEKRRLSEKSILADPVLGRIW